MSDPQEALEIRRRLVIKAYAETLARSGLNLDIPGMPKIVYHVIREAGDVATQDRVHRERLSAKIDGMWLVLGAMIPAPDPMTTRLYQALTVLLIHTETTLLAENIGALASVDTHVLPGLLTLLGALTEA